MKHGKKLTKVEKVFLANIGLDPAKFLVVKRENDKYVFVERGTDRTIQVPRG